MPTKDKHRKRSDRDSGQSGSTGTGGTPTPTTQQVPYNYAYAYNYAGVQHTQPVATPPSNAPAPATTAQYTVRNYGPVSYTPHTVATSTAGHTSQTTTPTQFTARGTTGAVTAATTAAPSYGVTHSGSTGYGSYLNLPYRNPITPALPTSRPVGPYANVSYSTGTGTGTGTTTGFPTYTPPVTNPSSAAWLTAPPGQVANAGVLRGGGAVPSTTRQPTGTNAPVVPGYYAAAPSTAQQGTDQGKATVAGFVATDSTSTSGAGASTSGVTRTFQPATLAGGVVNTAAHQAIATGHNVPAGTPMFFVSSFDIFKRPGAQIHPAFSAWAKDPSSAHYTSVMWRADDQNRILPMAVTSYGARHHAHSDPYKYIVRLHLNKDHKTFEYESLGTLTEDRPYDATHLHLKKKVLYFTETSGNRTQVLGDTGMFKPDSGNTMYPSHDDPHTRLHTDGISGTMIRNTWEIQNDKSLLISAESGKKVVGIITHDENADVYVVQAPIVFTHSVRKDPNHSQYPKRERNDLITLVFLALLVMPIGHSAFVTKAKWWAGKLVGAVAKGGSVWKG